MGGIVRKNNEGENGRNGTGEKAWRLERCDDKGENMTSATEEICQDVICKQQHKNYALIRG